MKHPTQQEVIKEYNLTNFEQAVDLCAHLLWVMGQQHEEIKDMHTRLKALDKQLWAEVKKKESGRIDNDS